MKSITSLVLHRWVGCGTHSQVSRTATHKRSRFFADLLPYLSSIIYRQTPPPLLVNLFPAKNADEDPVLKRFILVQPFSSVPEDPLSFLSRLSSHFAQLPDAQPGRAVKCQFTQFINSKIIRRNKTDAAKQQYPGIPNTDQFSHVHLHLHYSRIMVILASLSLFTFPFLWSVRVTRIN